MAITEEDISNIIDKESKNNTFFSRVNANLRRNFIIYALLGTFGLYEVYSNANDMLVETTKKTEVKIDNLIDSAQYRINQKIEDSIDEKLLEKRLQEKIDKRIDEIMKNNAYDERIRRELVPKIKEDVREYVDRKMSQYKREDKQNLDKMYSKIENTLNQTLGYLTRELDKINNKMNHLSFERSIPQDVKVMRAKPILNYIDHQNLSYHINKRSDGLIVTIPKDGSISQACMDYTGSFFTWKNFIYRNVADNRELMKHPDYVKPGDKLFIPKEYLLENVKEKFY